MKLLDKIRNLYASKENPTTRELLLKKNEVQTTLEELTKLLTILFLEKRFPDFYEQNKRILPNHKAIWNKEVLMVDNDVEIFVHLSEVSSNWCEWKFYHNGDKLFFVFFTCSTQKFDIQIHQNLFDFIGESNNQKANTVIKNYLLILTKYIIENFVKRN